MSAWTCHQSEGKVAQKIVPPHLRTPCWKGPGADSEEKREPASDINTCAVDSLKVLDPERPIREADIEAPRPHVRFTPKSGHRLSAQRRPLCAKSGLMQRLSATTTPRRPAAA